MKAVRLSEWCRNVGSNALTDFQKKARVLKVKLQQGEKALAAGTKAGFGTGFQHSVSELKVSMQSLQQDYDAVVVGTNTKPMDSSSALPLLGRVLLRLAGHLRIGDAWLWQVYSILACAVIPSGLTALLAYVTAITSGLASHWCLMMALTLCLFQLAVSLASFSFICQKMSLLLGPTERQLDNYAEQKGFILAWQDKSRRRLAESIAALLIMLLVKVLLAFSFGDPWAGKLDNEAFTTVFTVSLWFMAWRFFVCCYSLLHLGSGLELAVDSFCVRFYNQMSIQEPGALYGLVAGCAPT